MAGSVYMGIMGKRGFGVSFILFTLTNISVLIAIHCIILKCSYGMYNTLPQVHLKINDIGVEYSEVSNFILLTLQECKVLIFDSM